ncbi:MAG: phosphoribosylanthranilate isomerase [Lachnospira sp.]|nr:phosphoribosylanthranilate isomerase [Lachnospira sp.]
MSLIEINKDTKTKVKICGLTSIKDVSLVIREKADYAGMVMFFEKSKRNIFKDKARTLIKPLKEADIKTVAVVVSPSQEQVEIIEEVGFDYIQIHGDLDKELLENIRLPIIRALNLKVADEKIVKEVQELENEDKIFAVLFDAGIPGSGKTFDWNSLKKMDIKRKKVFLAGGLNKDNVALAIKAVNPDVVDVSSGVEFDDASIVGKCEEKLVAFIENARKVR